MRVQHISTLLDGGAATAARRLHHALLSSGVDSEFLHPAPRKRRSKSRSDLDETYRSIEWSSAPFPRSWFDKRRFRKERRTFQKQLDARPPGLELFSSPRGGPLVTWPPVFADQVSSDQSRHQQHRQEQTIKNLHWVSQWFDHQSWFGSLDKEAPIVWTLHDMNPFTGGCHFSDGCDQYQSGCGKCHQLQTEDAPSDQINPLELPQYDESREFFEQKHAALAGLNLHVVAPSRWLIESAKKSRMFENAKSFTHIPYGIDTSVYRPADKAKARRRLGIAPDAKVFCFGAMAVDNLRKGGIQLRQAIASLANVPNVHGIVFGHGQLPASDDPMPKLTHVGALHSVEEKRDVYSAADVFVLPSLEDNLPLTGLESLACGTPIIGFDAGGIPDYVHEGVTGRLAETGNADALGQCLVTAFEDPELLRQMSVACRELIQSRFASETEAANYQQLYRSLLDERALRAA